jgi:hypothetical protein
MKQIWNQIWGALALYAFCGMLISPVTAHEFEVGYLLISHPHAKPSIPPVTNGVGFLAITNRGETGDTLVNASTPAAESVEIHAHTMDGDVVQMRKLDNIDVASGETVKFESGGLHLMLIGLTEPLKKGAAFPLTLSFSTAGDVEVSFHVEAPHDPSPDTPGPETHDDHSAHGANIGASQDAHSGHDAHDTHKH